MKRRYNPFLLSPWFRQIRTVCAQVIIPLTIFQTIRTIFWPNTFDVILLAIFILIAFALHLKWI